MKKIIFPLLLVACMGAKAQRGAYCDPAVNRLTLTDLQGDQVNVDALPINTGIKASFAIANKSNLVAVPAGTAKLKITLGSGFSLASNLNNGNVPLADYFKWNIQMGANGGQAILTGDLYNDLPAGFVSNLDFDFLTSKMGHSTITCQFMISNHANPNKVLSDMDASNNAVAVEYKNVKPFTLRFDAFTAKAAACNVLVNWNVENEEDVKGYTVEFSEDGQAFAAAGTVAVSGAKTYSFLLSNLKNSKVSVRVKAESFAGDIRYSPNMTVSDVCNKKLAATVFPNPVTGNTTEINVVAKSGIFNGKYVIRLQDARGATITRYDAIFQNQINVKVKTGFIASGTYFVEMVGEDGGSIKIKVVKQ